MQETASSLVRGIQDFQNHQRWFEFYQRYGPLIRSILAQRGFKGSELDDAAQDVYLSMLATIERFKYNRGRGTFRSWLSRITHRTAKKYRERHESDDHEFPVDPQ